MSWHTVLLDDIVPTPWRNGGGITRELLAWPEASNWQWRASVAEVVRSGPFSNFVGVQRWFAVLHGDGVVLEVDGRSHQLAAGDAPWKFSGAAQTTCRLLGGATQDFNLMVKQAHAARMQRVNQQLVVITNTPKIIAIYANSMPAAVLIDDMKHECVAKSLSWMQVDADAVLKIQASDALWMEIDG